MRKTYPPELKAKIVLELLREEKTPAQISSEHGVHINQLQQWKKAVLEALPTVFERKNQELDELRKETDKKEEELYKEIGKLTTQLEWLKKKSGLKPPF
mgnify:CR=1 FL=1